MLDALTLDQLRTFLAVAEAGSFRAAAARLSRGQSAVSHTIANLEDQLGVTLFDRAGYRPVLTSDGRTLLEDTRGVLLTVDCLKARAHGLGEGVELELALIVDVLFPLEALGEALLELRRTYSTVSIRLSVAALKGPLAALMDQRRGLAITVGEQFRDPRIELEALSSVSFVAVAAASHALAARAREVASLSRSDLADHLQIVLTDRTALTEGQDFGVLSPETWRVSGQDVKYSLIRSGIGWGKLPIWQVERDLDDGRLVRLPIAALGRDGEVQLETYLAHRTDEPLGPAGRKLRDALLRLA